MFDCQQIQKQLAEQIMGTLNAEQTVGVEEHLAACPTCRAYHACLRRQGAKLESLETLVARDMPARQARAIDRFLQSAAHPAAAPKHWVRRIALAAGLLVLVSLLITQWGSSVDLAGVTYARVVEVVNQAPWLHIVFVGEGQTQHAYREVWAGFERGALAVKCLDGKIEYVDRALGRYASYDPQTLSISIKPVPADTDKYDLSSPQAFLQSILQSFTEEGAQLSVRTGLSQDRQVRTISAVYTYPQTTCTLDLYIDPQTQRLRAGRETWRSQEKVERVTEIQVSYPETGPTRLYDLGVPALAAVHNELLQTNE